MVVYSPGNKPVNQAEFEATARAGRELMYRFQGAGMDGLDVALGMLQALHEFVHWNIGEEGEDDVRVQLCGFFSTGIDNSDKLARFIERLARDCAVTAVDSPKGYTIEFSPSPAAHREEYDMAERAIRRELNTAFQIPNGEF